MGGKSQFENLPCFWTRKKDNIAKEQFWSGRNHGAHQVEISYQLESKMSGKFEVKIHLLLWLEVVFLEDKEYAEARSKTWEPVCSIMVKTHSFSYQLLKFSPFPFLPLVFSNPNLKTWLEVTKHKGLFMFGW